METIKKFNVVALDQKGEVVFDKTTKQSWSVSELMIYFDQLKTDLYTGKVHDVAISTISE